MTHEQVNISAEVRALIDAVPMGTRWKHRNGGDYMVCGHCVLEHSLMPGVLYRPTFGPCITWARDAVEFQDGRFERVQE